MVLRLHFRGAMMLATPLPPVSEDEALAERARRGDRAAFVSLVALYKDRVYRLAMRMSRNPSDAEEIVQETFLRAYKAVRTFQGQARFGTWLYRIAMNEVLMRSRASRRRPLESIEDVLPRFADAGIPERADQDRADDMLDRKSLLVRVRAALDTLDNDQRAALVLRDMEELSAEDAAVVLGISADAVRQRAHRARVRLREVLADALAAPT